MFIKSACRSSSEEGLVKVSLVDNSNNNAIDEQTSFSNPNDYTYNYDFDLTPYTDNTVVMLTLKIEDKEGQVVNKKITLTVKKFSGIGCTVRDREYDCQPV